jgi:hypothetical protein
MCSKAQTPGSECRMLGLSSAAGRKPLAGIAAPNRAPSNDAWRLRMWNKNAPKEKVDWVVIDLDEARKHLGESWFKTDTEELRLAEQFYRYIDWVNLFLGFHQGKRLFKPHQRHGTDLQSEDLFGES